MTILQTFVGSECPVCTKEKSANTAFCNSCYRKLPKPMQKALWKRFGSGFEGAFEEAFWWLRTEAKKAGQEKLFD